LLVKGSKSFILQVIPSNSFSWIHFSCDVTD
jgi:hypothetical protein